MLLIIQKPSPKNYACITNPMENSELLCLQGDKQMKFKMLFSGVSNLFLIKDQFYIILGSRDHYACRYTRN